MKTIRQTVSAALVIALASFGILARAQYQRPYRTTDRTVQQLIRRIENRADRFKLSLERALDRSRLDNTRREDNINQLVTDFEQATNQLRDRFNRRESTMSDVQTVLARAVLIDRFMSRHSLRNNAERDWNLLKSELNRLANYYSVAWNWSNPPFDNSGINTGLTGTYRINVSRSDDARLAVDRVVSNLPVDQQKRAYDALLRRIEAPEILALERRGQTVSLASSLAPQTSFEADGREHLEQYPNSRITSRVRAVISGDQLIISSTGDRATDYSVTFDPLNNGRQLRVTRRLYAERLTQPVVVQCTYDKTSDLAQWSVYTGTLGNPDSGQVAAEYVVPDGTMLVTRLNTDIDSTRTRAGDRFTLNVLSPSQFQGATIEGYVANVDRGGRITGRTEMALNLERIRLADGRAYPFEGLIESVRTSNGETVRVDTEGAVREDDSQSERTIKRTAIGTAIGAIIGAIAGGGKGAAVGALLGAGVGAGSVYVQGRNDLELMSGTKITVRAVAPRTNARR
jgi:hypothetical protein